MLSLITKFFLQFLNPLGFVAFVLFVTLFLIKKKPKTAIWFVLNLSADRCCIGQPLLLDLFDPFNGMASHAQSESLPRGRHPAFC